MNSYGINQFTGKAGLQSDKDCRPDYKSMCCFLLKEAFKKTVYFVIYLIHILIEVYPLVDQKVCGLQKNLMNNYKEWRGVG